MGVGVGWGSGLLWHSKQSVGLWAPQCRFAVAQRGLSFLFRSEVIDNVELLASKPGQMELK